MEDQFVHISEEEAKRWAKDPVSFKPDYCVDVFGYNAQEWEWEDPLLSSDGVVWMPPRRHTEAASRKEIVLGKTRMFKATW